MVERQMNKYEEYAIGHYLSDWPEEWSYSKVIEELRSGDEGMVTTTHYHYDGMPPEDLAGIIEEMTENLASHFAD